MISDAEFILTLRTDPKKSQYLSDTPNDVDKQIKFIKNYFDNSTDYYFIITDKANNALGTVRIYDIKDDSFCWGSWIIADNAPQNSAIESALLIYDFGFFALHYSKVHFDVRKANVKVVNFHKRLGATIVREDEINFYFEYDKEKYMIAREKYHRFLPKG